MATIGDKDLALRCELMGSLHFPKIESHQNNLYYECLRLKDFPKMRQIAMKLFKEHGSLYLCHAALANLLALYDTSLDYKSLCKGVLMSEMFLKKRVMLAEKESVLAKLQIRSSSFITILLYCLCFQGKYEESLKVLKDNLKDENSEKLIQTATVQDKDKRTASTTKFTKRDNMLYQAEILQEMKQYENAKLLFLQLLENFDDGDWRFWSGYLETFFLIKIQLKFPHDVEQHPPSSKDIAEQIEQEFHKHTTNLKEKNYNAWLLSYVSFTFRLILFQISSCLPKSQDKLSFSKAPNLKQQLNPLVEKYLELIFEYLEKNMITNGCFGSLRNFLLPFVPREVKDIRTIPLVPPPVENILLKSFPRNLGEALIIRTQSKQWDYNVFGGLLTTFYSNLQQFSSKIFTLREKQKFETGDVHLKQKLISFTTCEQVLRYLGFQEAVDLKVVVKEYIKLYHFACNALKTNEIEVQVFDDLALLSLHCLIQYYTKLDTQSKERAPILMYITSLLNFAQSAEASPYSFQLKMLKIELCEYLGHVSINGALESFQGLKIDYLQHLSMSFLLSGLSFNLGSIKENLTLSQNMITQCNKSRIKRDRYFKDTFKVGNYPKVLELYKIDRFTQNSHQLLTAQVVYFSNTIAKMICDGFKFKRFKSFIVSEYEGYFTTKDRLPDTDEIKAKPYHLGFYKSHDLNKLIRTYDIRAKSCWDCINSTSSKLLSKANNDYMFIKPPIRGLTASSEKEYKNWVDNQTSWCRLYIVFLEINYLLCCSDNSKYLEKKLDASMLQTRQLLLRLELVPLSSENSKKEFSTSIWQLFFDFVEFSRSIIALFVIKNKNEAENDKLLFTVRGEEILKKIAEVIECVEMIKPYNSLDTTCLLKLSTCIKVVLLFIYFIFQSCFHLLPKKKKKEKDTEQHVLFDLIFKIRNSLVSCFTALEACIEKETLRLQSFLSCDESFELFQTEFKVINRYFDLRVEDFEANVLQRLKEVAGSQASSLSHLSELAKGMRVELQKLK